MTRTLPVPPPRMARLPRNAAGYPVPWFVDTVNGQPDFRVVRAGGIEDAVRFRTCWLCGQPLGANAAFVIGPMCAINRVSPEPPSHRDCATYAAQACPFLTTPAMRRRDSNMPGDTTEPDGLMITRNPGVALVWTSRTWQLMATHRLFDVGNPTSIAWFAEGRDATRTEVLAAIDSGLPILRQAAGQDRHPAAALAELEQQHQAALRLIPADQEGAS